MNPLFSRMVKRYVKPMNSLIMNGMATSSLDGLEEYMEEQIKSVCQGFPSCFRYVRYERCTSQEEYEEVTRSSQRSTRRMFDLAQSSLYMVKLYFEFIDPMGKLHEFVRFVYLPFVQKPGVFFMGGSKYQIVPVLSDKVFTPNKNSIFVRLTQDRNNIFRMYNTVMVNGKLETRYVVWAAIYRSPEARKASSTVKRSHTLLTHYLFGKYGFTGAFQRYAGVVPIYGVGDDITSEKYPASDWVIYESTGKMPETTLERVYQPTKIKLAVKRSDWSQKVEALVFGFFYVVDLFPSRFESRKMTKEVIDDDGVVTRVEVSMTPEQKKQVLTTYLNDKSLWIILLGTIIFGQTRGEGVLYRDILEHFESLDAYLDTGSKKKLAERGLFLENYYDLLAHMAVHFNEMVKEGVDSGSNVYGKNMEVLSYILYDILYDLTSMKFALIKTANRRPLSHKDISGNLIMFVKTGKMFKLTSGKILTKSVSYSGDHMYPGITAVIAEQENRAGAGADQSSRLTVGPDQRIDLSMITVGSVLNLPKANPTPLARVNMWVTIDEATGTVLPNPDLNDLIEENKKYFKF